MLFIVQYDRTPRHTGAVGSGYRASGGLGASQQMVDAFFMANGKLPISGYTDNGKRLFSILIQVMRIVVSLLKAM